MERVLICRNIALETGHEIKLRIEDARLRKWYGNAGREELQGAGSVNRTISLTDKPAKMKATPFSRLAGWRETASERGRDAARRKIKRRVSASPSNLLLLTLPPTMESRAMQK